ncbi:MAG: glycosyltransferase [Clostridia bacterium]|nr:glycosyltransferase [Clostridia bacterium]
MRLLFVSNIPSPYRVDFFNELGKECDLTVCFEGECATDRNEAWKAQDAYNFNAVYLNGIRTSSDKFLSFKLKKYLKEKWDCIIFGGYATPTQMLGILYLRRKKIPFVLEADGGIISAENDLKYRIKKFFISSASAWFGSGKKTTEYFVHYGANKSRCFEYPFTSLSKADLDNAQNKKNQIAKTVLREKLQIKEDKMVLSVGRFSYNAGYGKGYDFIMCAAEKTKDKNIGYYIVGDEPTEEFVKWKKSKHLEHVHFVGFKKKDELSDYYLAADLFVLMTRSDVWGLVVNEAMSYGLPVISTNMCVAACELVKDGFNGYVIDINNAQLLPDYIEKTLYDVDYLKLSLNSEITIKDYTIENMADAHINFLNELIK